MNERDSDGIKEKDNAAVAMGTAACVVGTRVFIAVWVQK